MHFFFFCSWCQVCHLEFCFVSGSHLLYPSFGQPDVSKCLLNWTALDIGELIQIQTHKNARLKTLFHNLNNIVFNFFFLFIFPYWHTGTRGQVNTVTSLRGDLTTHGVILGRRCLQPLSCLTGPAAFIPPSQHSSFIIWREEREQDWLCEAISEELCRSHGSLSGDAKQNRHSVDEWAFSKNMDHRGAIWPRNYTLSIYPSEMKTGIHTNRLT